MRLEASPSDMGSTSQVSCFQEFDSIIKIPILFGANVSEQYCHLMVSKNSLKPLSLRQVLAENPLFLFQNLGVLGVVFLTPHAWGLTLLI